MIDDNNFNIMAFELCLGQLQTTKFGAEMNLKFDVVGIKY